MSDWNVRAAGSVLLTLLAALLVSGAIWRQVGSVDPSQPLDGAERAAAGALSSGREIENVVIPPGWRLEQVAQAFDLAGVADGGDLVTLARRPPPDLRKAAAGAPTLEGFLAPGTYRVARGIAPKVLLAAMVRRFWYGFTPNLRRLARQRHLSVRQVVTLASIVQREATHPSDMPGAAGVFLNRLGLGMPLGSEPTITYAIDSQKGVGGDASLYWARRLTATDIKTKSPYNTYRFKGLPPGPIAAPTASAIRAVLSPAHVPYRYFVGKPNGALAYARTLAEHRLNIVRYIDRRGAPGPARSKLQTALTQWSAAAPAHVGVVMRNLATGETATLNDRDFFTSAGVLRPLVMAAAFDEIRRGRLHAGGRLAITPDNALRDAIGTQEDLGRRPTVLHAVRDMVELGSNAATTALVGKIGAARIEALGRALGLHDTYLTASRVITTPRDVARLLEEISDGRAIGRAESAKMRAILLGQQSDGGLPSGAGSRARIAHVAADVAGVHHDAGIVYTPKGPVLVVAMTEGIASRPLAVSDVTRLTQLAVGYFTRPSEAIGHGTMPACGHGAYPGRSRGPLAGRTIALDPAHGGGDPGSVVRNGHRPLIEKRLTLAVADRLRGLLTRQGATVYLTRCGDVGASPFARAALANGVHADLLVSIELEASAYGEPGDGTAVFYLSPADSFAANYMVGSFDVPALWRVLNEHLALENRGRHRSTSTVLLYSAVPSIVTDAVSMTNPGEVAALARGGRIDEIARGHLSGILNYFARLRALGR